MKTKSGLTLIETLIYVAGLVVVLSITVYLTKQVYDLYSVISTRNLADNTALAIIDNLTKEIRASNSLNLSESSFEVATGKLSLNSKRDSISIKKLFTLDDGRLTYKENDLVAENLSPENILISRFELKYLKGPVSEAVRYELEISYPTRLGTESRTYPGFAILRHSYE